MRNEYDRLYAIPSLASTIEGTADAEWVTPQTRKLAAHLLWMPSIDRDALVDQGTGVDAAAIILARAKTRTVQKLSHLGLTLYNYFDAYEAFGTGNSPKLRVIEDTALRHIVPSDEQPDTKSMMTDVTGNYTRARQQFHHEYVSNVQRGIRPSNFPVMRIVMGPFGAGKTEKLRDIYTHEESMYISDPDSVRQHLMNDYDPANHAHVLRTSREVTDISDIALYTALGKRFSVLCETSLRHLDWWKKIVDRVSRIGYRVELHMAARPIQDCFRRVIATRDRPARVGDYLDLTKRYSNFFTLINHPRVTKVTLSHMTSTEGTLPVDCPLTGEYIRAMQEHPKVISITR
jgi:hypothetical protein